MTETCSRSWRDLHKLQWLSAARISVLIKLTQKNTGKMKACACYSHCYRQNHCAECTFRLSVVLWHVSPMLFGVERCLLLSSWTYTGCPRRNVPDFGRVFLRSNYTDITQNTCIQSSMVTEILAREKCGLLWCLRSILCPWRDPLDLRRDNPAVACSSQRRPWLRNRCSECIVVGSQWTTMTRVRVFL